MKHRVLWSCACALALLPGASAIDDRRVAPSSAGVDELKRLDGWVGAWKGTGWVAFAPGPRVEFQLSEHVTKRAGGTVLLVEGRGTTRDEQGAEHVTHDGLALVYFDAKSGQYRWNGHDRGWGAIDAQLSVADGKLEWTFAADERGTRVRFAIRFDDEHWREVGELSGDGETWTRFMETTLARE